MPGKRPGGGGRAWRGVGGSDRGGAGLRFKREYFRAGGQTFSENDKIVNILLASVTHLFLQPFKN